jgi:DNA sulfur modification protein DndC
MMVNHGLLVNEVRARLRDVNLVSFSGGKDSTTVLQLVLAALAGTDKRLYIVTADTRMEIPYFQDYVERVKGRLRAYIDRERINAEVVTVMPPAKDSFWAAVLGKGYPSAHMGFRWCTGKLKIDPITTFTKTVTAGREYTVFVGVRSAESALRARIYIQKDYKPHHFAPILDWSAGDVWEYLLTEPCPWGDHTELVQVYRYSSDECVYGEAQGVCVGNARYGCWACPLQKSTQLDMIGMHTGDDRYRELKWYKEVVTGMANKKAYRSRIRRNGSAGAGPFLVEIRKSLYADLKKVEARTGWQLITPEEETCIFLDGEIDERIHDTPDCTAPMLWDIHGTMVGACGEVA